ncbi:MAG TPA: hypothetical protein VGC30_12125 [Dokdonella sp.]
MSASAAGSAQVDVTFIPAGADARAPASSVPGAPEGKAPTFTYFGSDFFSADDPYLIGNSAVAEDGHIYTAMACDDLHYTISGFPSQFTHYIVNDIRVDTYNNNLGPKTQSPVTVGMNLVFFDDTGVGGGPGNLLYHEGYIYYPNPDYRGTYVFTVVWLRYAPPLFALHPERSNVVWACVFFDNLGNSVLDETYMNNLGILVDNSRDPDFPRVGTSDDKFFIGDAPQTSICPGNNEAGHVVTSAGINWSEPLNTNTSIKYQAWDPDTLWRDSFDASMCAWPYFIAIPPQ